MLSFFVFVIFVFTDAFNLLGLFLFKGEETIIWTDGAFLENRQLDLALLHWQALRWKGLYMEKQKKI